MTKPKATKTASTKTIQGVELKKVNRRSNRLAGCSKTSNAEFATSTASLQGAASYTLTGSTRTRPCSQSIQMITNDKARVDQAKLCCPLRAAAPKTIATGGVIKLSAWKVLDYAMCD